MLIDLFTDGSCSGNPGPSGWGFIVIDSEDPNNVFECYGATTNEKGQIVDCTNQQAEMMAAYYGLKYIHNHVHTDIKSIRLCSDSAYLLNGLNYKWYKKWRTNGWITTKGTPVENKWLWMGLAQLIEDFQAKNVVVQYIKIKGHKGDRWNERADVLANMWTQMAKENLIGFKSIGKISTLLDDFLV